MTVSKVKSRAELWSRLKDVRRGLNSNIERAAQSCTDTTAIDMLLINIEHLDAVIQDVQAGISEEDLSNA